MASQKTKFFILLYICVSLAGLVIHLKLHSPTKSLYFWWASPVNIFSLVVIPYLFVHPRTVPWGYLFNAFTIVIGTIGMGYFSLLNIVKPLTLYGLFMGSTLPAIIILWFKWPLAHAILREARRQSYKKGGGKE